MIRVSNKGLSDLEKFFQRAPEAATMAARMAINDTATRQGMTLIRKEMMAQVAFPAGYLSGDRLFIAKRATNNNLEAVVLGRKRATSLARFAAGTTVLSGKGGVQVRIKSGRTTYLKRAFLVRGQIQRRPGPATVPRGTAQQEHPTPRMAGPGEGRSALRSVCRSGVQRRGRQGCRPNR